MLYEVQMLYPVSGIATTGLEIFMKIDNSEDEMCKIPGDKIFSIIVTYL